MNEASTIRLISKLIKWIYRQHRIFDTSIPKSPKNLKKMSVMEFNNKLNEIGNRKLNRNSGKFNISLLINRYLFEASKYTTDLKLENNFYNQFYRLIHKRFSGDLQIRNKTSLSLIIKLRHNISKSKEHGDYYLFKIVNDLIGFRIILPNINEFHYDVKDLLNVLKQNNLISRFYFRKNPIHKRAYKAFHVYIGTCNRFLPWELQIWDTHDKLTNYALHKYHERRKREF